MIASLWQKEVVIEVLLSPQDNADWCPALPLLFKAKWNHYIGFYYELMQSFFSTFQPFPYQSQTFWVQTAIDNITLTGTEIISNLFAFYSLPYNEPIRLICHYRGDNANQIDLKRYFKNNLKASTCIRYGKFGSSVITVDMTVNSIDDMFNNFKESKLQAYLGQTEQEGTNLGYRFIIENKEKIDSLGVRILGKDFTIERKIGKQILLRDWWLELGGGENVYLRLHGVALRELQIKIGSLQNYCHPDGFLYFTIN